MENGFFFFAGIFEQLVGKVYFIKECTYTWFLRRLADVLVDRLILMEKVRERTMLIKILQENTF